MDDNDLSNDQPYSMPDDVPSTIPIDHPETDSRLDEHELYDEGLESATDIDAQHEEEPDPDQQSLRELDNF